MRTFRGRAAVRVTPVTPAPSVVFAIATDFLSTEQLDGVKKSILDFYRASKGQVPTRLAVLNPGLSGVAGPVKTRAQLVAALREITLGDAPADPTLPLRFFSTLGETLQPLGGDWAVVVLTGDFPTLPAELTPYAGALLSARATANRQRLFVWNLGASLPAQLGAAMDQTAGLTIHNPPEEILQEFTQDRQNLVELDWDRPALTRGFHFYEAQLLNAAGQVQRTLPSIAQAPEFALPGLERYAESLSHVAASRSALAVEALTETNASGARTHLDAALALNPRDASALQLAADLYDRLRDFKTAASLTSLLVELQPLDGRLSQTLGHRWFLAGDLDEAQKAHLRARELEYKTPEGAAELGIIHAAHNDPRGALPYFEESLAAQPANQALWFARADASAKLGDWSRQAESLEKGVAPGGNVSERRTSLVRLLLDHQETQRAAAQIEPGLRELGAEAEPHAVWAGFLEELKRPGDALAVWRKASALAPEREDVRYAIARLVFAAGDMRAAQTEAESGLAVARTSARIFLIKARALEAQGRILEARLEIKRFAPGSEDVELIRHAAWMEDLYGREAPAAYQRLAGVESSSAVLQRGLKVALRDNDLPRAGWFAEKLSAAGQREAAAIATPGVAGVRSEVLLPGGHDALMFIARGQGGSSLDHFFVDYAKAILLGHPKGNPRAGQEFSATLRDYFQRLQELCTLGQPSSGDQRVTRLVLSVTDKKQRRQTERALNLLGWKVRANKGDITVEFGEKSAQARKQDMASALGIDQVGMQDAFAEGRAYTLEIPWERVPIVLDEQTWRDEFYAKEKAFGGLAEVMARDINLARLYAGLSVLDAETARVVTQSFGLHVLAQHYSEQMIAHASSLAIENNAAAVPGGPEAFGAWAHLAGADPRQPGRFFRALFERNDGDLLAYYSTLAGLDLEHQRFYTRSSARLAKFYDLYRESPDNARAAGTVVRETSFGEFLRRVPLDTDGTVMFPGSPELWMVVKGKAGSVGNTSRLLKKIHKKVAPDVEDEILLRLGRTRYTAEHTARSELENFLAVVRVEEHRDQPLDEESALLLAQHSAHYPGYYPYFAAFTALSAREFAQFFQFAEKANELHAEEANILLGHFHALMEILRLAVLTGAIEQPKATEIFGRICDRFTHAATMDQLTVASSDTLKSLLPPEGLGDPASTLRDLLVGHPVKAEWVFGGVPKSIDVTAARIAAWDRVLEIQKAPSLTTVMAIVNAASNLAAGPAAQVALMEANAAKLPAVDVEKGAKLEGKEREHIRHSLPDKVLKAIAEAHKKVAKSKKIKPQDIQTLSSEVLAELEPQMRLALAGILYAYYFRPSDLLLADDPLLLRRHRIADYTLPVKTDYFAITELKSGPTGSFLAGSFVTMATAAGQASMADLNAAGGQGEHVASEQIGSIRLTHWPAFGAEDQRRTGLRLRAAREWIVEAATGAEFRSALAADSAGYLSPARRHDLLEGLERRDWKAVWNSVTLGDLNSLGQRMEARLSGSTDNSPVFKELFGLSRTNDGARLNWLGPNMYAINGCMHPHFAPQMPYEEFERYMFPNRLAERVSEFKLYLAEYFERAGIPPAFLPVIAEPAARRVLSGMKMADFRDWPAVLAAFKTISDEMIDGVLAKQ
ncbi:MAG: hypothetical protein ABSD27_09400 [Bryobacteraceae bacterium]